jgi:hypothetical protein
MASGAAAGSGAIPALSRLAVRQSLRTSASPVAAAASGPANNTKIKSRKNRLRHACTGRSAFQMFNAMHGRSLAQRPGTGKATEPRARREYNIDSL